MDLHVELTSMWSLWCLVPDPRGDTDAFREGGHITLTDVGTMLLCKGGKILAHTSNFLLSSPISEDPDLVYPWLCLVGPNLEARKQIKEVSGY